MKYEVTHSVQISSVSTKYVGAINNINIENLHEVLLVARFEDKEEAIAYLRMTVDNLLEDLRKLESD